jgi:hypothetical protein
MLLDSKAGQHDMSDNKMLMNSNAVPQKRSKKYHKSTLSPIVIVKPQHKVDSQLEGSQKNN